MDLFLKSRIMPTLEKAEEKKNFIAFAKRWMEAFAVDEITYNDLLYYVRLTHLTEARKKDPLHKSMMVLIEAKIQEAEAIEIKKLKQQEDEIMHISKIFVKTYNR